MLRLLLTFNQQQGAGLGNQHDVVGRYYHDHLQGRNGYFIPSHLGLPNRAALHNLRQVKRSCVMGCLKLFQVAMGNNKLLNINCLLYSRPDRR